MIQNYVTFLSPGTFVAETDTKKIDEWDVNKAVEMSKDIIQRYGALPYGFYFKKVNITTLNRKQTLKQSGMYYLGGEVLTLQEVKDRNDPEDSILISNMECNGYDKVVVNSNSYEWTQALEKDDTVLNLDEVLTENLKKIIEDFNIEF